MLFDACGKTGLPALGDAGIRMSRKRWRIVAQHVLDGGDGPIFQRRLALFHVTRALPGFEGVANQLREVLSRDRGLGSKLTFSSIHGCKLLVSVRVSAPSCSNDIRQLSIMRRFAVHAHEMLNTAERQISCVCVCVCTHHRGCFTHSPRSWRAGQLQWMMKGGSHAHRYRCRVAVLVTGNRSLVWCLLHVLMLHEHVPAPLADAYQNRCRNASGLLCAKCIWYLNRRSRACCTQLQEICVQGSSAVPVVFSHLPSYSRLYGVNLGSFGVVRRGGVPHEFQASSAGVSPTTTCVNAATFPAQEGE